MAPRIRPPIERFLEKTRTLNNGCVEWTAYVGENGYGRFWIDGKNALAHRWSYEFHKGPIPDGLVADHLCRNTRCVNPDHLEPVTTSENVRRGAGPQIAVERYEQITHCPQGHEYTEENTYRGGRGRTCWTCKRAKRREDYARNRDRAITRAREWRLANPERARQLAREGTRRYRAKKKAEAA